MMKKRLFATLLAVCLLVTGLAIPASATDSETGVMQTIRALGIMVGDESGNLNLEQNVTRAEFSKMLVAASSYKDSIGADGVGYSLFRDVKSSHWASEYIKIALDEGWMMGYTDGTFRPSQTIRLEEACTTVLRLLGYDAASLAGSYPSAQLNKASALGLRDEISLTQGQTMTRRDCMNLFYQLMTAQTSSNQTYAATLGYQITNGEVDYASLITRNLSGPYVARSASLTLPFSGGNVTVYRNGAASTLSAVQQYDVYYYSENLRTVWIYTDRVSGTLTDIQPSAAAPTAVTVAGNTYTLGTAAAVYQLSSMGGVAKGDTVTLLLGMDGTVADVVTGSAIDARYYGVVLSCAQTVSTGADATTQMVVRVADTDGAVHDFREDGAATYATGAVVSVSVTRDGVAISRLNARTISGAVNAVATKLGDTAFAADVRILDTKTNGAYAKIYPQRLAGTTILASDVRYYALNQNGEITDLILDDVTGDCWSYGYLNAASGTAQSGAVSGSYTYLTDGKQVTLQSDKVYSVTTGGLAVLVNPDGSVDSMRNLSAVTLTSLGTLSAVGGGKTYAVWDTVQVYLRKSGTYSLTTRSAVNGENYTLTGWYDSLGCAAGGKIRIIIAEEK
ncbi:MAG: S-layer homology domain-containing protein [Oscillospiraceae bacterium]|nr:S-layer homology domain-containing protein [Oscillospiraceae bacterium]